MIFNSKTEERKRKQFNNYNKLGISKSHQASLSPSRSDSRPSVEDIYPENFTLKDKMEKIITKISQHIEKATQENIHTKDMDTKLEFQHNLEVSFCLMSNLTLKLYIEFDKQT